MWSLRKTRSGNEFSPFPGFLGEVLVCETDIESALRTAITAEDKAFDTAPHSLGPELSDLTDLDGDDDQETALDETTSFIPTGFSHLARHIAHTTPSEDSTPLRLPEVSNTRPRQQPKRPHSPSPPPSPITPQSVPSRSSEPPLSLTSPPLAFQSLSSQLLQSSSSSSPSPASSQLPSQSQSSASNSRKKRRKAHSRSQRAEKVAESKAKFGVGSVKTRLKVVGRSEPLKTNLDTDLLPAASGGYTSKPDDFYGRKKPQTLQELNDAGLRVFKWNGFDTIPILDSQQIVCAILQGQPSDASYAQAVKDSYDLIKEGRDNERWEKADKKHKRHKKPAAMYGVSYGKGQKVPARLSKKTHAALLDRLVASQPIRRIAGFQSGGFALWAPRTYAYYRHRLSLLYGQLSTLTPNFPMSLSIFPCCSFNFGPRNWCWKHKDTNNCPFGWCGITAFGPFDPTKGGHLILWDLKLVIEFPPGSTILIPSAVITHSNVPVQEDEDRVSFTQYCAGGLFRWVDNGFRTDKELLEQDPAKWEEMARLKETRWQMGLGLFSTLDELLTGRY